jgi:hypothetical protein
MLILPWRIDMAKAARGIDMVADELLEHPAIGEAAIALALPDQRPIEMDFKDPTGPRYEGDALESVEKVESSSCAIHAERSIQLHWVQ